MSLSIRSLIRNVASKDFNKQRAFNFLLITSSTLCLYLIAPSSSSSEECTIPAISKFQHSYEINDCQHPLNGVKNCNNSAITLTSTSSTTSCTDGPSPTSLPQSQDDQYQHRLPCPPPTIRAPATIATPYDVYAAAAAGTTTMPRSVLEVPDWLTSSIDDLSAVIPPGVPYIESSTVRDVLVRLGVKRPAARHHEFYHGLPQLTSYPVNYICDQENFTSSGRNTTLTEDDYNVNEIRRFQMPPARQYQPNRFISQTISGKCLNRSGISLCSVGARSASCDRQIISSQKSKNLEYDADRRNRHYQQQLLQHSCLKNYINTGEMQSDRHTATTTTTTTKKGKKQVSFNSNVTMIICPSSPPSSPGPLNPLPAAISRPTRREQGRRATANNTPPASRRSASEMGRRYYVTSAGLRTDADVAESLVPMDNRKSLSSAAAAASTPMASVVLTEPDDEGFVDGSASGATGYRSSSSSSIVVGGGDGENDDTGKPGRRPCGRCRRQCALPSTSIVIYCSDCSHYLTRLVPPAALSPSI